MDKSEKQQSPTPETEIEKPEKVAVRQEQLKQTAFLSVANDKKNTDFAIGSETKTVQQIFSLLEKRTKDKSETPKETIIDNPEEILENTAKNLSQIENPTINDVSKALIISGMDMQAVEAWLIANRSEIQFLALETENLENKNNDLSTRLNEERRKNFLAKLFRIKERQGITAQLGEVTEQILQADTLLRKKKSHARQIERVMQELSTKQQGLALEAVGQLFQGIAEKYEQLKEKLTTPEVKQELNADLIAKIVSPRLEKLQSEGEITKEDVEEYVGLLKMQLSENVQTNWNDPNFDEKKALDEQRKQLDNLYQKAYSLKDISRQVSSERNEVADSYYDRIFDFLIREATKEKIEQLHGTLSESLDPKLQEKIAIKAKEIIHPYFNFGEREKGKKWYLDIKELAIHNFDKLEGLERWPIVKNFAISSGIISEKTFACVEEIVIQRLFDKQLFPGGYESSDGTAAAGKMGDLGNPKALPLMLHHIETYGSGHTNNCVVYAMEQLLKESDPAELQQVLEVLPRNKKILLEILADENSCMSRFGRINSRYFTCNLLKNGEFTIAKEKLTKILDENGRFDKDKLRNFYLGNIEDAPETLESFLKAREQVEKIIIDSKLAVWTQSADKLLAALVNPHNGESAMFPKKIAQEGLGISDEKILKVIEQIFTTKTFKGSGFERETFLDGLVLLNSKENSKVVLETLLNAYRGAKDDPKRMRRIFQLISTLDGFGEYDFIMPNQDKVGEVNQEIIDLQNQYSQTQDKIERKKIKNRIETLNSDRQNLTGLKGIEDIMTKKVVEVVCRRLELPQEYQNKIENNLEELLKSEVFEIIPSLAGNYEIKKETEVKNLLKVITTHIIDGDFKLWRYAHERSQTQLADLTEEQKGFWKKTIDPIIIEIEPSEDEQDKRASELKAAQEIIKNAKEHILNSQPNFDFSKERAFVLSAKISELTEKIKSATSEEDKKRFVAEKRSAQSESILINGVLEIENATPKSFTREKILTQARELRSKVEELNLPLASLDIEQIEKIFTVGDIKKIIAFESDDPIVLLKIGVEPQETCQSWRKGGFNECLLAYVADSNKKVLNITDSEGQVIARSVIKLTNQINEGDSTLKSKRNTLLVEKPYSLLANEEIYRAFMRLLLTKAQGLNASITFGKNFDETTLRVLKEEARTFGYVMKEGKQEIFIPQSLNKHEYSDTLGGKISWFDRYQQLEAITFEK